MRGKTSPLFPSFLSSLSWTALTYCRGPEFGWHGSFGLPAATQPCRVGLRTADVRGNSQRCHVLPDTLRAFFSPHGCTSAHKRRARWSRGDVSVSQYLPKRDQGWQTCQQVLVVSLQKAQSCDMLGSYIPACTRRQLKLQTVVKRRQPFHSCTLACIIMQVSENKPNSTLCLGVRSWERAWFGGPVVLSGKSESAVSKAVMIKCPLVKLKGQKQLVFLLVRLQWKYPHAQKQSEERGA